MPLTADGKLDKSVAGKNASYVGTQLWSAPEVCPGKTKRVVISNKADIFPYGLTLIEMMTNASPHSSALMDDSCASFDEDQYEEVLNEVTGKFIFLP